MAIKKNYFTREMSHKFSRVQPPWARALQQHGSGAVAPRSTTEPVQTQSTLKCTRTQVHTCTVAQTHRDTQTHACTGAHARARRDKHTHHPHPATIPLSLPRALRMQHTAERSFWPATLAGLAATLAGYSRCAQSLSDKSATP